MENNKLSEAFPEILFVRHDSNNQKVFDPLAYTDERDAIEDDGPTTIAQYKFVSRSKRKKEVVHA